MGKKKDEKKTDRESPVFKNPQTRATQFHIAAIGASADGLHPLKAIFSNTEPGNDKKTVIFVPNESTARKRINGVSF